MLNKTINKLKKKNKPQLLKSLFSSLAFVHYPLSESQRREALNILGIIAFKEQYSYLRFSKEFERQLIAFSSVENLAPLKSVKVAVCLSGDTRSFSHCIPQLQRFFSGYDITFFCHGWKADFDNNQISSLNNAYTLIEDRPDFSQLERSSIKAFGFKKFGELFKIPFLSPNIFPMWYGVKRAFDSIEEHGFSAANFDLICRCRYDNFFLGQLAQLELPLEPNQIIIDPNYDGYGGYGDQFAIGKPQVMKKYFALYDWLPAAFKKYAGDNRFFPEVIIKKYLVDDSGIEIKQTDFGLRLLRNDFIGLKGHKIPLRSHSVSQTRNKAVSEYIKNKFPDLYNETD